MLEAETSMTGAGTVSGGGRGLPDRLRNWSGRMGGSLSAMVDTLTKGTLPTHTPAAPPTIAIVCTCFISRGCHPFFLAFCF